MKKIILILIIGLNLFNTCQSANFCVDSITTLHNALIIASNNGEDDHIRLKSGDYIARNGADIRFYLKENFDITISGGWSDFNQLLSCFVQSMNPMNTVLDGNGLYLAMSFLDSSSSPVNNSNISIKNLTISNGFSSSLNSNVFAAGLTFYFPDNNYSGDILLDRLFFIGNKANKTSALKIHQASTVLIRNSVFTLNQSNQGQGVVNINLHDANDGFYFINNTVYQNRHDVDNPSSLTNSGLFVTNAHIGYIANNLFSLNQGKDINLFLTSPTYYLFNNNFQNLVGNPEFHANNISTNPMLSPYLFNFTPLPGSPLIDAGLPVTILDEWDYGSQDFDGFNRVINGRVDIGAVEAPPEIPIFENGFE